MTNDLSIDDAMRAAFDTLYFDLRAHFRGPGWPWISAMERPAFWQLRKWRDHILCRRIFAAHGLILHQGAVDLFYRTEGQRFNEDAGGAIVRRLRQAFQGQTGIPYHDQ